LLQRKTDSRIDDEQSDDKRQQAERRQVEVKAVGEAFEIALRIRLDQVELVAGDFFKAARGLRLALPTRAGNLIRHFQQPLGDADIDHQHIGHKLRLDAQRRQQRAVVGDGVRPSAA
jgi:hypothetical protein